MKKASVVKSKSLPPSRGKEDKLFKVIVTWVASEHTTEKEARAALKKLKPQKGALGVVIQAVPIQTATMATKKR